MRESKINSGNFFPVIIILALSAFFLSNNNHIELNITSEKYYFQSNNNAYFDSAGTEKIAITGEPIYFGDTFKTSILVSNQGNNSGNLILFIENNQSKEQFQSQSEFISSGSSKEMFVVSTASNLGKNVFNWWIISENGIVNESLSGQFEINVLDSQIVDISIDSLEWSISEGLEIEYSTFLSPGKNREVIFDVIGYLENSKFTLQSINSQLDPGIRKMSINLGQPQIEFVEFNLAPDGWKSNINSSNHSAIEVTYPHVSPISSIEKVSPSNPLKGTTAIVDFSLENIGNSGSTNSIIRIQHLSTNQILSEQSIPPIAPGNSYSGTIEIADWPDEKIVDFKLIWTVGSARESESSESTYSVESFVEEEEFQSPVDISSLAIGIISGISLVLASRLIWGTISVRTPHTSDTGLRETRVSRKKKEEEIKIEIQCPFCEQILRVPADHNGQIKCPSCTKQFNHKQLEESKDEDKKNNETTEIPISRSNEDLLDCPQCNQKLRVPIDRRPVNSRCPVCKTEFLAEKGD